MDPGWLDRVDEEELCRAASKAATELVRSFAKQARKLKLRICTA